MKIALFRNTQFDHTSPWSSTPMSAGYVQVSGWVEVDFPPLSAEQQAIAKELIALGERQKAFENDFKKQRRDLEKQAEELLGKLGEPQLKAVNG